MLEFLQTTSLFSQMAVEEIGPMLQCLGAVEKTYEKGATIARHGDMLTAFGVVISGLVHVSNHDVWGNHNILTILAPGDLFGATYVICERPMEANVSAMEPTKILYLDVNRVMKSCTNACPFHARLIKNLLRVSAENNMALTRKTNYLARRSTREKLLAYLSRQSQKQNSLDFTIPLNRQQLADYLAVDRSAMSNELSKLRREQIIDFDKNWFHLIAVEHI